MKKPINLPLKPIKCIINAIWWILLFATTALLICILSAKIKGEVPQVCGYSIMKIVSGSMEPEIPAGAYIWVRKTDPADIRQGDVISFYSQDKAIYGMPNTHRVIQPPTCEDGVYVYTTKGDAGILADRVPATSDTLIGVYGGKIEWLNALENALNGKLLLITMVALQLFIILLIVFSYIHASKNSKTTEKQNTD